MALWKPFAAIAAVALLAAAGPAAVAQTATTAAKPPARNTKPYPAEFRVDFMAGCTKDKVLNEAQCGCIYRNLERDFTQAEFVEMDQAAAEGNDHPNMPRMKDIVIACYTNPAY